MVCWRDIICDDDDANCLTSSEGDVAFKVSAETYCLLVGKHAIAVDNTGENTRDVIDHECF